ncbi:MAG TPA: ETX/MTX2 family pore-forming toxin [Nocardioides sp.]|uniref:ETX/MTX2 family pore-forming toxin n=1 Tax=uncultured Nocardioides sp. TaxID=198441 RepID=UPI000EBCE8E9|nr:ETX/MTX2 family pore-forming toxin [uncultured Nocardioides sp.]HCB07657.1 hypothetical protein [Nocardioides sp.]HRI95765.1 ETX/MTX2 family pore-forming toxin [Nocardioides sp.]HRK45628.1 ETX/MTX2 family pore-forming toxin [Nocardioides sp.]
MSPRSLSSLAARSVVGTSLAAALLVVPTPSPAPAASADSGIIVLNDLTRRQIYSWTGATQGMLFSEQNNSGIVALNPTVKRVGPLKTTPGETWYVGDTYLTNRGNTDQNLTTPRFELQVAQSLTTEVKVGIETEFTVKTAFKIGETGVELGVRQMFNWSRSTAETTSKSATYSAWPQTINVPARTTARVAVTLQQVTATGEVALETNLGGTGYYACGCVGQDWTARAASPYEILGPYVRGTTVLKKNAPALPPQISVDPKRRIVHFKGSGTFTATYGTIMTVDVTFQPLDPRATAPADPDPYTITPEVEVSAP